jgi:hypothetical protein
MQKSYGSYLVEPDSLVEVFPLSIGNEWTYSYNWSYQSGNLSGVGDYNDTGFVTIKIIDKVVTKDSTKWIVQENFNLWVQYYPGLFTGPTSTIDTIELVELHQDHRIYNNEVVSNDKYRKSIFPFPSKADTMVYRYDKVNAEGIRTFTTNDKTNQIYSFTLKQGIGLILVSIDDGCFCMWGYFGNHTLRSTSLIDAVNNDITQLPKLCSLSQNYPNPFNPSTTIQFSIPVETMHASSARVTLKVYDVLGREVVTLVNETKQPGNYEVKFEGANLPSGVYFYKLTAGDFVQTKKLMLIK